MLAYEATAKKPCVAGYIRVSTEDQAREGFSLEAQGARLRKYCEAKGWSLIGIYKDENSGRETTRPDYRRMMADMDTWDILLVVKQDRIHRNVQNFYEMVDDLRAHGKQFASVEESIDTTTATGWAFIGILAIWTQLELDQISERVGGLAVIGELALTLRPSVPATPPDWLTLGGYPLINWNLPLGVLVAASTLLLWWSYRFLPES